MRFMMLMIPRGYETASPGEMPEAKAVEAMMKYNESLQKAGVLLALDGLHPPSMGARVSFEGGKPRVKDGPFAEAKEVVGGYAVFEAPDLDAATKLGAEFLQMHIDNGLPNVTLEIREIAGGANY